MDRKVKDLLEFNRGNEVPLQDDVMEYIAGLFTDGKCRYVAGKSWVSVMFNGVNMVIDLDTPDDIDTVFNGLGDFQVNDKVYVVEASCLGKIVGKQAYRIYVNYTVDLSGVQAA